MININIVPAKSRFGRPKRKQWKFEIVGANGEPVDPRDTYANVGDIRDILQALLVDDEIQLTVHYLSAGEQKSTLRSAKPF